MRRCYTFLNVPKINNRHLENTSVDITYNSRTQIHIKRKNEPFYIIYLGSILNRGPTWTLNNPFCTFYMNAIFLFICFWRLFTFNRGSIIAKKLMGSDFGGNIHGKLGPQLCPKWPPKMAQLLLLSIGPYVIFVSKHFAFCALLNKYM